MSVSFAVGAFKRIGCIRRPLTSVRQISWMPFEQPDPSLYTAPPSLQPKRPLTAEAIPNTTTTTGEGNTTTAKIGTAPILTPDDADPNKTGPSSAPASAMATGPMPLSQIQKRSFYVYTNGKPKKEGSQLEEPSEATREANKQAIIKAVETAPTLRVCLHDQPATWPVVKPRFPEKLNHGDTWSRKID
ncbi:hypothetical protein F5Y08DRAFT_348534 [Xylaria arbuscula]|nr:hypothetical protein F5Y08DRAFT_348534 [Xylaria arbuscula]